MGLLDLAGSLIFDGLQDVIDGRAFQERREVRRDGRVEFVGEDAVIDSRHLDEPVGELLPNLVAAEEIVRLLIGLSVRAASSEPTAPRSVRIFW